MKEGSMSDSGEMRALAERFFGAVVAGDINAVREMYAPEAVIWHAHTNEEQSVEENLRTLVAVAKYVKGFGYDDQRCVATEDGFVEQHVTRGTAPNGEAFTIPACIVCTVVAGRITRLDEYFDSAAAAPLLGR